MKSILRIAWIAPAFLVAGLPAAAQQFPTKPIRIISPFAPGGGTDFVARLIAPRLTLALGQQVIVDNRPGAGGTLGTEIGVRSAPDGYTFVLISAGYCVNPSFYKIKFDPIADIAPIIQIATGPLLIAARPALPATTVKELIALAKSKPGRSIMTQPVRTTWNIWPENCLVPGGHINDACPLQRHGACNC